MTRSPRPAALLRRLGATVAAASLLTATVLVPASASASVPQTSVETSARCVAGEVVHVVRLANGSDGPVTVAVSSPYGERTLTLDAGGGASLALATRRAFVPAGEVVVTTTAAGETVGTTVGYPTRSCGDAVVPVVAAEVSPPEPDGAAGWWTSPVTVAFSLAEGAQADVEHRLDDGAWVVGPGPVVVAEDGRYRLEYRASVDGVPVEGSGGRLDVALDTTAPEVLWGEGVADGATFVAGEVPAAPGCTALDATSGPGGCEVTGYSAEVGQHTLTATATDVAGNAATSTRSYTVTEPASTVTVEDFWRPVVAGRTNPVLPGRTLLLQFRVLDGGDPVSDLAAVASVSTTPVSCTDPGAALGPVTELGTDGLRYRNGRYSYPWRSDPAGSGCVSLTVTTVAGASRTAWFEYQPRATTTP